MVIVVKERRSLRDIMVLDDIFSKIVHDHAFSGELSIEDWLTSMNQIGMPDEQVPFFGKKLLFV